MQLYRAKESSGGLSNPADVLGLTVLPSTSTLVPKSVLQTRVYVQRRYGCSVKTSVTAPEIYESQYAINDLPAAVPQCTRTCFASLPQQSSKKGVRGLENLVGWLALLLIDLRPA